MPGTYGGCPACGVAFRHIRRPCRGAACSRWHSGGFAALHRRLISAGPSGHSQVLPVPKVRTIRTYHIKLRSHPLCWSAPLVASAALLPLGAAAQGPLAAGPGRADSRGESAHQKLGGIGRVLSSRDRRALGVASAPVSYGSPASVTGPADTTGESYPNPGTPAAVSAPVLVLATAGASRCAWPGPWRTGRAQTLWYSRMRCRSASLRSLPELAFVKVSSNGVDFVRFPAQSLTPVTTQTGHVWHAGPAARAQPCRQGTGRLRHAVRPQRTRGRSRPRPAAGHARQDYRRRRRRVQRFWLARFRRAVDRRPVPDASSQRVDSISMPSASFTKPPPTRGTIGVPVIFPRPN